MINKKMYTVNVKGKDRNKATNTTTTRRSLRPNEPKKEEDCKKHNYECVSVSVSVWSTVWSVSIRAM